MTRTRLERVRASVAIASLALQQIEDDLNAGDVDQAELAAILRELSVDADPSVLDLAPELLADDAGMRPIWAARRGHRAGRRHRVAVVQREHRPDRRPPATAGGSRVRFHGDWVEDPAAAGDAPRQRRRLSDVDLPDGLEVAEDGASLATRWRLHHVRAGADRRPGPAG
ncbi:hypothetical protein ACFV8Z_34415 [Streptomyces sp. NPDC059837]|uniref:hypothetical protein n=1 Tax=unclassified Streptomyces TaxID=2593676 RepID=UPI003667A1FA